MSSFKPAMPVGNLASLTHWEAEYTRRRLDYDACAKKRRKAGKAGKPVWPSAEAKSKKFNPFPTDCRKDHKRMQKAGEQVEKWAAKYEEELKKKGLLTAPVRKELGIMQNIRAAEGDRQYVIELAAHQQAHAQRATSGKIANKGTQKKPSKPPKREEYVAAMYEEPPSGLPLWLVGIAAVGLLGGIGYLYATSETEDDE
jgi:hypothetical protein